MTDADCDGLIAEANKETLWWAMFRLLGALHSARAYDPNCIGRPHNRGGPYNVVHLVADHWGPQIPGMPDPKAVAREIAEDEAYHELTYAAERMGIRITGDEFIRADLPAFDRDRLIDALRRAREMIACDREIAVDSFTMQRCQGTADPDEAEVIAEYDDVLAQIDGALHG